MDFQTAKKKIGYCVAVCHHCKKVGVGISNHMLTGMSLCKKCWVDCDGCDHDCMYESCDRLPSLGDTESKT